MLLHAFIAILPHPTHLILPPMYLFFFGGGDGDATLAGFLSLRFMKAPLPLPFLRYNTTQLSPLLPLSSLSFLNLCISDDALWHNNTHIHRESINKWYVCGDNSTHTKAQHHQLQQQQLIKTKRKTHVDAISSCSGQVIPSENDFLSMPQWFDLAINHESIGCQLHSKEG